MPVRSIISNKFCVFLKWGRKKTQENKKKSIFGVSSSLEIKCEFSEGLRCYNTKLNRISNSWNTPLWLLKMHLIVVLPMLVYTLVSLALRFLLAHLMLEMVGYLSPPWHISIVSLLKQYDIHHQGDRPEEWYLLGRVRLVIVTLL